MGLLMGLKLKSSPLTRPLEGGPSTQGLQLESCKQSRNHSVDWRCCGLEDAPQGGRRSSFVAAV